MGSALLYGYPHNSFEAYFELRNLGHPLLPATSLCHHATSSLDAPADRRGQVLIARDGRRCNLSFDRSLDLLDGVEFREM